VQACRNVDTKDSSKFNRTVMKFVCSITDSSKAHIETCADKATAIQSIKMKVPQYDAGYFG